MRISELSGETGVAVPTLKYYLREQLLHEGRRRSGNQTEYDESHVRRVRLVRALVETGGLSIADAKRVLATLGDEPAYTFAAAQHAMGVGRAGAGRARAKRSGERADDDPGGEPRASGPSRARIAELATARGWRISPDNPGLDVAAKVLDDYAAIDFTPPDDYLDAYFDAAATVACVDVDALRARGTPESVAELMIVGTVVGDALAAGLRRLAHQDATAELFPVSHTPTITPDPEGEPA